jgi:hypothetical protein
VPDRTTLITAETCRSRNLCPCLQTLSRPAARANPGPASRHHNARRSRKIRLDLIAEIFALHDEPNTGCLRVAERHRPARVDFIGARSKCAGRAADQFLLGVRRREGGGRARSPGIVQRSTGARCTGPRSGARFLYRASAARSARREAQLTLKRRHAALDRPRSDLELPVRRLPFDRFEQELRPRRQHLRDEVD